MKVVSLEQMDLAKWVAEAEHDQVVITRDGEPVALLVGIENLDAEQLELSSSDSFWKMITQRRAEKTVSRAQIEEMIRLRNSRSAQADV
jgi:prevent-host-death family protein